MDDSSLYNTLYQRAVALLARREHSELELTQKLLLSRFTKYMDVQADEKTAALQTVIKRLQQLGYQSDERFADMSVRHYLHKGYGSARICQMLKQKGLSEQLLESAISANASGDLHPQKLIYEVWEKKFGNPPIDLHEKAKQGRFLAARGFSFDDIAGLFNQLRA